MATKNLPTFTKISSLQRVSYQLDFPTNDPQIRDLVEILDRALKDLHNRINDLNGLNGETTITAFGTDYVFRNGILVRLE